LSSHSVRYFPVVPGYSGVKEISHHTYPTLEISHKHRRTQGQPLHSQECVICVILHSTSTWWRAPTGSAQRANLHPDHPPTWVVQLPPEEEAWTTLTTGEVLVEISQAAMRPPHPASTPAIRRRNSPVDCSPQNSVGECALRCASTASIWSTVSADAWRLGSAWMRVESSSRVSSSVSSIRWCSVLHALRVAANGWRQGGHERRRRLHNEGGLQCAREGWGGQERWVGVREDEIRVRGRAGDAMGFEGGLARGRALTRRQT
jgi:hypothetical protein